MRTLGHTGTGTARLLARQVGPFNHMAHLSGFPHLSASTADGLTTASHGSAPTAEKGHTTTLSAVLKHPC